MFDLSLVELAVIALVALLVLGPEKLPRAARTVGLYARKARQSWYAVKADIERELAADELKRSVQAQADAVARSARGLQRELTGPIDSGDALAGDARAVPTARPGGAPAPAPAARADHDASSAPDADASAPAPRNRDDDDAALR